MQDPKERTLFTACLYPLISPVDATAHRARPLSQVDVALWLAGGSSCTGGPVTEADLCSHWRSSLRVSLGDILEHADLERRAEESTYLSFFTSCTYCTLTSYYILCIPIGWIVYERMRVDCTTLILLVYSTLHTFVDFRCHTELFLLVFI